MKENATDVTLLLDRSGSMASVQAEAVSGVNNFIKEQAKLEGECKFTLIQFDSENPQEIVLNAVPIKEAKLLTVETFSPRGWTPLLDAMGTAIEAAGRRLEILADDDRPEHVVFVIVTDGMENASRKFSRKQVMKKVKHQTDAYQWKFVYLGANQDAIAVGGGIGVSVGALANYNTNRTPLVYASASANLRAVRSGERSTMDWSDEQKKGFVQK